MPSLCARSSYYGFAVCLILFLMLTCGCRGGDLSPATRPSSDDSQNGPATPESPAPSPAAAAQDVPQPIYSVPSSPDSDFCGQGRVFDIGGDTLYPNLSDFTWSTLQPGDTVRVHSRTEPYREKLLFSFSGAPENPICVVGVPDAGGKFPVIDGENATTHPQFKFYFGVNEEPRGVVILNTDKTRPKGYKPRYVVLKNLDIRGGHQDYSFTDSSGAKVQYKRETAAIYVYRGEHLTFIGCTIRDSGNGSLVVPWYTPEERVVKGLVFSGNYFVNNGVVNSSWEHGVYTEALRSDEGNPAVLFEYNHFGRMRSGSLGSSLKDRSAGPIIRYNTFESNRGRALNLPEGENLYPLSSQDPLYSTAFVYGNVFHQGNDNLFNTLVYWGGDNGNLETYRNGTLHFYHNTVYARSDRATVSKLVLFGLANNDQKVDARNNIIYVEPETQGAERTRLALLDHYGTGNFGRNLISLGWYLFNPSDLHPAGTITGTENFIASDSPGFVAPAADDFHLTETSPAIDEGSALAPVVIEQRLLPDRQYVNHQGGEPRPVNGPVDLGAFEAN